jgi:hypothetical protein
MFRKIGFLCAALAMFSIAGGHWAVWQGVAWAEMLVSYSQTCGSLAVAVDRTFDGQHPCPMCQDIQAAKSKEQKESPATPSERDDVNLKAVATDPILRSPLRLAARIVFPAAAAAEVQSRTEAPPTPPPRQGLTAV